MPTFDPPSRGVYRETKVNETVGSISLSAGDLFKVNIASVNVNVSSRVFFVLAVVLMAV